VGKIEGACPVGCSGSCTVCQRAQRKKGERIPDAEKALDAAALAGYFDGITDARGFCPLSPQTFKKVCAAARGLLGDTFGPVDIRCTSYSDPEARAFARCILEFTVYQGTEGPKPGRAARRRIRKEATREKTTPPA
jgi:hypothetical protein